MQQLSDSLTPCSGFMTATGNLDGTHFDFVHSPALGATTFQHTMRG